jgi:hypothetical protein
MSPRVAAILSGTASVGSALVSALMLGSLDLATLPRMLVALLPVPFFLWFIVAEVRWVRQMDEFHRRVVADALAAAFPATILLAVAIDGLQRGGFLSDWTIGDLWPGMALLWVPALWISWLRYTRER